MTLFEVLLKLTDNRDLCGRRHHLAVILLLDILGKICGYVGILAKKEFIENNKEELLSIFEPVLFRGKFPSPNTFTRAKAKINFSELNELIYEHFSEKQKFEEIHIDGKAIRSTVEEANGAAKYDALVSAYANKMSIFTETYKMGSKEKGQNEGESLRKIVEMLGVKGAIITADALHCQKKQ